MLKQNTGGYEFKDSLDVRMVATRWLIKEDTHFYRQEIGKPFPQ
jgi:hypothetical protein